MKEYLIENKILKIAQYDMFECRTRYFCLIILNTRPLDDYKYNIFTCYVVWPSNNTLELTYKHTSH